MKLSIAHQNSYSRVELLLRTFFGVFYIVIPHAFLLFFVSIWASILSFIAWWVVLFTGKYPESFYEFQVKMIRWSIRLQARVSNLSDGYPAFGMNGTDDLTQFDMNYPEKLSRGLLLLRTFFWPIYVGIPHGFILIFRTIASAFLQFLAWWVVLFTGNYPASWHEFNVGTIRWATRVNTYISFLTDDYPPFTGAPDPEDTGLLDSGAAAGELNRG